MKRFTNTNSIVQIIATQGSPAYMHMVAGTGWFPKHEALQEGTLITNAHVVRNAKQAFIRFPSMHSVDIPVYTKGISTDLDIAVLQIKDVEKVKEMLGVDAIPTLPIGNSDHFMSKEVEDKTVTDVGYPLGTEYQMSTMGRFSGLKHAKEQVYMVSDASINPGNSGGPQLDLQGQVIGMNTMKLKGATEINMQIPINRIMRVLPHLLDNSENKEAVEKWMKLAQMAFNVNHPKLLTNEQIEHVASMVHGRDIDLDKLKTTWETHHLGGHRRTKEGTKPVTFSEWYKKHIHGVEGSHLLFDDMMTHIDYDNIQEIHKMRSKGFKQHLCELCSHGGDCSPPKKLSASVIPPRVLHYPRLAFKTSNSTGSPTLNHYGNPPKVNSGVVVSDVIKGGLMDRSGLQKYDFIYNIVTPEGSFDIDNYGESWYDSLGVSLQINDIIHRTPFDQKVELNIVRGKEKMALPMNYTYLRDEFKPSVRSLDSLKDMPLSRQVIKIQGITVTPLRLNHVMAFRLGQYLDPHKQNEFKIVVADIDTGSRAFHARNFAPGDILTKINDKTVESSWEGFINQLRSIKDTVSLESERGAILIL